MNEKWKRRGSQREGGEGKENRGVGRGDEAGGKDVRGRERKREEERKRGKRPEGET